MNIETQEATLGETIRTLRLEKGMSMRVLAAKADLKSVAFIADVEKGYRNPSPEVLTKLAGALEIDVSRLRKIDTRPPVAEIRSITNENPEWAMAFRRVVDMAKDGVTPDQILHALSKTEYQARIEGT